MNRIPQSNLIKSIKRELNSFASKEKALFLPKFFKTGKGEYAEGDKFIGVTVPNQRLVAKKYYSKITLNEIEELLESPIHEHRLTALIMLVYKFEKTNVQSERDEIFDLYLSKTDKINNWDLVDLSAPKILGAYLFEREKNLLYDFAKSDHLWKQRISIVSTYYFIKRYHFEETLKISEILLNHKHDLIQKAVGWMLREIGNINLEVEINFLNKHYKQMPRTMLRYAIEKFDEDLRQKYLKGKI
ncbi:MAG: DNA alkylation repair protein [Ignavibacterium sp.]|nr:DNA alkylation repair protein [Ignavibacterium sp.]MCX7610815.1 DNA alkylation repair protein [Ignavibacterium sp.]MDW8374359.1 DNA alkylation repair protein [Ignavibacteriales bacterium]